jgi:hypothetical protein
MRTALALAATLAVTPASAQIQNLLGMGVDAEAGQACRMSGNNPMLCDCIVNVAKQTLPDMKERQAFYHFMLGRVQQGTQMMNAMSQPAKARILAADNGVNACKRFK